MKTILLLAGLFILMPFTANANDAFVGANGMITVSREVDTIRNDGFSIRVNDEDVDIQMDELNEDTIDYLTDSGIVKRGSYVTINGKLDDGVGGSKVIKAENIQLYAQ